MTPTCFMPNRSPQSAGRIAALPPKEDMIAIVLAVKTPSASALGSAAHECIDHSVPPYRSGALPHIRAYARRRP